MYIELTITNYFFKSDFHITALLYQKNAAANKAILRQSIAILGH
jgi:hypothetical protein